MDPLELAVLALRLALVLVLYAFLVAVLRAAREGLRSAPEEPAPAAVIEQPLAPVARSAIQPRTAALQLVVVDGGESGLPPGLALSVEPGTVVGRGTAASLVVADSTVSSTHARFEQGRRGWQVVDLGSTNGTYVDERRVSGEAAALKRGAALRLGTVRFQVA